MTNMVTRTGSRVTTISSLSQGMNCHDRLSNHKVAARPTRFTILSVQLLIPPSTSIPNLTFCCRITYLAQTRLTCGATVDGPISVCCTTRRGLTGPALLSLSIDSSEAALAPLLLLVHQ